MTNSSVRDGFVNDVWLRAGLNATANAFADKYSSGLELAIYGGSAGCVVPIHLYVFTSARLTLHLGLVLELCTLISP